jgi:hypothetical protein
MSQEKPDEVKRKKYSKPTLEKVKLMPEEAVLGACKNPGTGGCPPPGQPDGRTPGS